jgi:hypothetical protein
MELEFDPVKHDWNLKHRALGFDRVVEFEFETAVFSVDSRRDYGETRWRALVFLDGRLHALVFVEIAHGIRVISFRKANKREVARYEQKRNS